MKQYDVIIIGGGVVGTAIARQLSRYHVSVALLEKEEELAFGVSKSNSGIIHPGTQNPPQSLKGRLCVEGNRRIRTIAAELGVDFKEVGELIVAFTEEDVRQLHRIKQDAALLGVPRLRIVGRQWLIREEPQISKEVRAALYAPSAGIISPYRLAYDLSENAVKNGAVLLTQAEVKSIACKGRNSFEVQTPVGCFNCRYIVNAAGLYADSIARMAGITDFTITPRKGEEFLLDKKREYLTRHLLFPLPAQNSKGILVIKTADGNPMIGPTAFDVEDKQDRATSDQGLSQVLSAARRVVPSINAQDIIAYFAGLRPVAGNDFIIRHEDAVPGMITVAGIQSPGLTAAPAIAVMVQKLLAGAGLTLKKKFFFQKNRKKTIHLFSIPLKRTRKLIAKNPAYGDIVCRCEMVSAQEIRDAIHRGARTMDGIKFRTRAQAGRCHGSFCTTRIMKILSEELQKPLIEITKRGKGSELVVEEK